MDTEEGIVSGPFSDNYTSHSRSYTSTSAELLNFRMQELSKTPISTTRIRYRSVSNSTDNLLSTSASTQIMSKISQWEMSNFGDSWSSNLPLHRDFLLSTTNGMESPSVYKSHWKWWCRPSGIRNCHSRSWPISTNTRLSRYMAFGRVFYVPGITANILSWKCYAITMDIPSLLSTIRLPSQTGAVCKT